MWTRKIERNNAKRNGWFTEERKMDAETLYKKFCVLFEDEEEALEKVRAIFPEFVPKW